MKNMSAILFLGIISAQFGYALELRTERGLPIQQALLAHKVIERVQEALPQKIQDRLPFTIDVQFAKNPSSEGTAHLGQAKIFTKKIVLNENFLTQPAGESSFTEEMFQRALVHEIAHFYDYSNNFKADHKNLVSYCDVQMSSILSAESQPSELCRAIRDGDKTISDDPEFQALTNWVQTTAGFENINRFERRLSDPYAVSGLGESFPVFFESYIFDTDFACRMPALNRYFDRHFGIQRAVKCDDRMTWYLSGEPDLFRTVRRDRIWAIDYLWAAEGLSSASAFGHSMLRLIVCAPDRALGPDCYKDFDHHIVLSFAASTESVDFGNLAGISGKYPLNLYASSFYRIKTMYNLTELRDLYAVPLKLTFEQKDQMIDSLYEAHWNLDSTYYFVTRNCTSEISRLFMGSGISLDVAYSLKSTMPSDLLTKILNSPLTFPGYHTRTGIKENRLLYFPSSQKNVDLALSIVSMSLGSKLKNIKSYSQKMSEERFQEQTVLARSEQKLLYALYYLESLRFRIARAEIIQEELRNNIEGMAILKNAAKVGAKENYDLRFAGSYLKADQYGIPTDIEAQAVADKIRLQIQTKMSENQPLVQATADLQASVIKNAKLSEDRMTQLMNLMKK